MDTAKPRGPQSDRALVGAVLAHAPGAFEALVDRYQRLCWHIINRMVRHPEDTRDLCQETFLRVHRHLHQYRFESPLKSWVGQVAYSVALRYLERKQMSLVDISHCDAECTAPQLEGERFDLETASANDQLVAAIHAEIEALPPLQRTVLTLYHMDEMTVSEIASITGFAEGTIRSHLFRTRARLRARVLARIGEPR